MKEPEFNDGFAWAIVIAMITVILVCGPFTYWWIGQTIIQ